MRRTPSPLLGAIILCQCLLAVTACSGSTDSSPGTNTPSASQRPGSTGSTGQTPTTGGTTQSPTGGSPTATPAPTPATPATPAPQPPAAPTYAKEWYVSPTGNDAASGAKDAPFRTLGKALSVVGPGEIVRVQAGTYAEPVVIADGVKAGTPDAKITLKGEGKPVIVPGGGDSSMLRVAKPYWIIDGFEIDARQQPKIAASFLGDTTGTVLTNSELHGGRTVSGVDVYGSSRGVTIENNKIYDFSRGDDDSHGVVVEPTAGDVTIRNNDIHDVSGDSVQCIGPEGFSNDPPADGVVIEGNDMHDNRENAADIKTCYNVTIRNNKMHGFRTSHSSKGEAIVVHLSARNVTVESNDISDAGIGIAVGGNHFGPRPSNITLRNNQVHDLSTGASSEGNGIRIENCDGVQVQGNTVARTPGFAFVVAHGTGGNSSNVTVKDNTFAPARGLVSLGEFHDGLTMDNNRYAGGCTFQVGNYAAPTGGWTGTSFAQWQALGLDTHSVQAAVGAP